MAASPVLRRAVLWRWRDGVGGEERLAAKEGLAYIAFASAVDALDFGEDLGLAGASNYGLALLRDHADKAHWDLYDRDPHHHRVGARIDALTREELTARADYRYAGRTPGRGEVRHLALRVWREGVEHGDTAAVRRGLASLRHDCPSLLALELGDDLGYAGAGRADLVVEARFAGAEEAAAFLRHPGRLEVEAALDLLSDTARTASIEYRARSG